MRFGVLGPLAVWTSQGRPVRVPEVKVRLLLAGLLVDPGRVVPADRLVEDLWGGALPANPAASLQTRASQLRRALEGAEPGARALLVSRAPGYFLDTAPEDVDSQDFRTLIARARAAADPAGRAALLGDALALWRGPAFGDVADHPFARAAVTRLEEQRLTALEDQAEVRVELGEHDLVADELGDQVERHPLRERLRAVHMRALYRSGRQAEALESYQRLRTHLADTLGLDPGPDLVALHQAVLAQDPALGAPPSATAAATAERTRRVPDLPVPTSSLVGRDEDVARVRALLGTARLVTLTGPGGVGKTRLALAAADAVPSPDGVRLVELSGVTAGSGPGDLLDAVTAVVAAGLDVRDDTAASSPFPAPDAASPVARLADAVRARRLLLVLDNCEHVAEPVAALVAALLRAAPGVRVLATSQVPLALTGEHVWPVRPLTLPEPGAPARDVRDSAAVRLFTERAAAADPAFEVTDADADAVAALCRRLDGVPLALELAATRVRALGVHALAARLDDRFALLSSGPRDAPDRQRTLRAVLDWSWEPLPEGERAVLRRLSVHADGCDLEAAEAVCADADLPGPRVLDLITGLVDRSLVTVAAHGPRPRYRLLESVAAYAAERLRETGEEPAVRRRHLDHYTALAERADPHLRTADQRRWLRLLDTESANLRRALETATATGAADAALRLVNAQAWYWVMRGRLAEGVRALDAALALAPADGDAAAGDSDGDRRTAALWREGLAHGIGRSRPDAPVAPGPLDSDARLRAGWYLLHVRDGFSAGEEGDLTRRVRAGARGRAEPWVAAALVASLARKAFARSDLAAIGEHAGRALALFTELGDRWGQALATYLLGSLAEVTGDLDTAARHHRAALRTAEALELWTEVGERLTSLGRVALLQGDFDRSEDLHERARRIAVEHGHVVGEESAVLGLGLVARRRGDLDAACEHLGAWLDWHLRAGSDFGAALILAELGFAAEQGGDAPGAEALHRRGLEAARRTGDPRALALALEGLAGARSLAGDPAHAARLLGAADALRDSVGAPLPPAERGDVDRIEARVGAALEAGALDKERGRGRGLTPDQAVESPTHP
ncbi:putative ATPase [Nocardiopsis sp. Huas11]|uniref:AfsR/SARP family transcriptional regulator n=1 Tax=Nocardiopsis sp. Huas11 TaxID=2183912 RepID=UPI000EB3C734|nr:BTAD domain-containing putative transcriptional regulator [Nocardiopsis sp. Huas11]RKS08600.1 putative ATPase [Nocardiopsis sp. Huas11]